MSLKATPWLAPFLKNMIWKEAGRGLVSVHGHFYDLTGGLQGTLEGQLNLRCLDPRLDADSSNTKPRAQLVSRVQVYWCFSKSTLGFDEELMISLSLRSLNTTTTCHKPVSVGATLPKFHTLH